METRLASAHFQIKQKQKRAVPIEKKSMEWGQGFLQLY